MRCQRQPGMSKQYVRSRISSGKDKWIWREEAKKKMRKRAVGMERIRKWINHHGQSFSLIQQISADKLGIVSSSFASSGLELLWILKFKYYLGNILKLHSEFRVDAIGAASRGLISPSDGVHLLSGAMMKKGVQISPCHRISSPIQHVRLLKRNPISLVIHCAGLKTFWLWCCVCQCFIIWIQQLCQMCTFIKIYIHIYSEY